MDSKSSKNSTLPKISELGHDLLCISPWRRAFTLAIPFGCVTAYFVFAFCDYWSLAIAALVYLSFVTYGSISHDLVHCNLGLSRKINDVFLSLIELLALRSGHAYRAAHLHHHRVFPHDDDIEGAASRMTLLQSLCEGVTLQFRIYLWAMGRAERERGRIKLEGISCALVVFTSLALVPLTLVPLIYVILIVAGSWVIPLITSYIPHNPAGQDALRQTRRFRGIVASVVALEHLYHLEHHLYPAVPHHNWPRLAKRLDPYLDAKGVKAVRLWK